MTEAAFLRHGDDDRADKIMMMNIEANCFECKHLHDDERTCAAYPDGIPTVFLYLEEVHDKPHIGDHGIRFDPIHEHGIDESVRRHMRV